MTFLYTYLSVAFLICLYTCYKLDHTNDEDLKEKIEVVEEMLSVHGLTLKATVMLLTPLLPFLFIYTLISKD